LRLDALNPIVSNINHVYDSVLALIYPQACAVCGDSVESRRDGVACAQCWASVAPLDGKTTQCWKCGAPSRDGVTPVKREAIRCGLCDDFAFTAARSCGRYEGALRACILALKREPVVARELAARLYQAQQYSPINRADFIVPVPLHPDRERERGFNQAVVLARALANESHLPFDEHSLVRRLHTERHRAGMDARARRESVAGAFEVRHPKLISGRCVLLVDDVFTTGATVSECASVLRDSGAAEVFVLTVARA
jgi:ComF family protein